MDNAKDRELSRGVRARRGAYYVTTVAIMTGLLSALKFALSFIPNVEVVTVLILVFASVWGVAYVLPATIVFCLVEMAIYGVGSWVLLYFIYFPLLSVISALLLKKRNIAVAVGIGVIGSILFGVLSACCDTLITAVGTVDRAMLGKYWVAYYVRGIWFDLVHTISSFVTVIALYIPLCRAGDHAKRRINSSNIANNL